MRLGITYVTNKQWHMHAITMAISPTCIFSRDEIIQEGWNITFVWYRPSAIQQSKWFHRVGNFRKTLHTKPFANMTKSVATLLASSRHGSQKHQPWNLRLYRVSKTLEIVSSSRKCVQKLSLKWEPASLIKALKCKPSESYYFIWLCQETSMEVNVNKQMSLLQLTQSS